MDNNTRRIKKQTITELESKSACHIPTPDLKWLLVLSSAICFFVADGCSYSFGIFYTELVSVYGEEYPTSVIALLSGMLFGLPQISGPLVCPLIEVLKPHRACALGSILMSGSFLLGSFMKTFVGLLVILGLLTSLGLELLYATALTVVLTHFNRHRGLATGLTVFGGGVGALVFAQIHTLLDRYYLWRGAMMVESAIFLHAVISACLYLLILDQNNYTSLNKSTSNDGAEEHLSRKDLLTMEVIQSTGEQLNIDGNRSRDPSISNVPEVDDESFGHVSYNVTNRQCHKRSRVGVFYDELKTSFKAMRHRKLWQFSFFSFRIISLLMGILVLQPWIFIHSYSIELGFDEAVAGHILSVMGIAYAVGQIVFGPLADHINAYVLYGCCIVLFGASCLMMGLFSSLIGLVSLGIVFGVSMGGTLALYSLLITDMVGEELLYSALGLYLPFVGIGNLISGPLSAWLEAEFSYSIMFKIGGFGMIVIGILFIPFIVWSVRKNGLRRLGQS